MTSASERIPNANGWTNPYRCDSRDRVRADAATGLDWMSVRAYDPSTGRFIARDPLGRAPLFFADNPYVYAGNNPLSNVDPSGQYRAAGVGAAAQQTDPNTNQLMAHNARVQAVSGCASFCKQAWEQSWIDHANSVRTASLKGLDASAREYYIAAGFLDIAGLVLGFDAAVDVLDKIVDFVDLASVVLDVVIPNLGMLGQDKGWGQALYSEALAVGAWLNEGVAAATAVIAAYRAGGCAVMTAGVLLGLVDTVAEGIPGLLEKLFGSFVAFALQSGGAALTAIGNAVLMNETNQQQMDIFTWCRDYGGGSCG